MDDPTRCSGCPTVSHTEKKGITIDKTVNQPKGESFLFPLSQPEIIIYYYKNVRIRRDSMPSISSGKRPRNRPWQHPEARSIIPGDATPEASQESLIAPSLAFPSSI